MTPFEIKCLLVIAAFIGVVIKIIFEIKKPYEPDNDDDWLGGV